MRPRLAAFAIVLMSALAPAWCAVPLKVVVLPFEQAGDLGSPEMQAQRRDRMVRMRAELKQRLAASGVVEVVDEQPAQALIERLSAGQFLHRCNGCELDIARALKAEAVITPWMFRMSQLVVTMHIEMKDAATGRLLLKRALDFRNDADGNWSRTLDYLVRDLREGRWWNGKP
jgi:hypothetical protein